MFMRMSTNPQKGITMEDTVEYNAGPGQATETITPEVLPPEALAVIVDNRIAPNDAVKLKAEFNAMFADAEVWIEKAKDIQITDVTQTTEIRIAHEMQMKLRGIRTSADKRRKQLGEDARLYINAVNGMFNVLKALVEPVEAHLEYQKKFAERLAEEQRVQLRASRELALKPYAEVFIPEGMDLAQMSEEHFDNMVAGAKLQMEAKKKAAEEEERLRQEKERLRKEAEIEKERLRQKEIADAKALAEEQRKAKELADARHKSLRQFIKFISDYDAVMAMDDKDFEDMLVTLNREAKEEAERLAEKAEQEKKERIKAEKEAEKVRIQQEKERAKAQAVREKAEAEAEKLRLANKRLEEEAKRLADEKRKAKDAADKAEADRIAEQKRLEEKAAKAPDKSKLLEFAADLTGMLTNQPVMSTEAGTHMWNKIVSQHTKYADWVRECANKL